MQRHKCDFSVTKSQSSSLHVGLGLRSTSPQLANCLPTYSRRCDNSSNVLPTISQPAPRARHPYPDLRWQPLSLVSTRQYLRLMPFNTHISPVVPHVAKRHFRNSRSLLAFVASRCGLAAIDERRSAVQARDNPSLPRPGRIPAPPLALLPMRLYEQQLSYDATYPRLCALPTSGSSSRILRILIEIYATRTQIRAT